MSTQVEVAKHLDLSANGLRRLQQAGVIPTAPKGGLNLADCRRVYIRHLRAAATGRGARTKTRDEFEAVKLRTALYQLGQLERTLVPIDEVMPIFEQRLVAIRQIMLAIPNKIAPLVAPDDPAKAQDLIYQAVCDALEDARHYGDADDDGPAPVEDDGPKIEAEARWLDRAYGLCASLAGEDAGWLPMAPGETIKRRPPAWRRDWPQERPADWSPPPGLLDDMKEHWRGRPSTMPHRYLERIAELGLVPKYRIN